MILRIVTNNTDLFASEDSLHDTLLLANGVVRPVMTTAGEIIMIPSSTAFDAMPEEEFKGHGVDYYVQQIAAAPASAACHP